MKGNYILLSRLEFSLNIAVGKLGSFLFAPGYYLYFGSAQNGLEQRVNRHLRKDKKTHWHIDYLLQSARVVKVWSAESQERLECNLAGAVTGLPGFRVPVVGFGSSDCRCSSHLIHTIDQTKLKQLPNEMEHLCGCKLILLWPLVTSDDL